MSEQDCTAYIPLGTSNIVVDVSDLSTALSYKWELSKSGYARRKARREGVRTTEYLHRVIAGAKPGDIVDHINRDKLDCRRSNLRLVSPTQNNMNRPPNANRRDGLAYKGVYKNRKGGTFSAKLCGKYLGNFSSAEDAARAYDEEARSRFGSVALLNFGNGVP